MSPKSVESYTEIEISKLNDSKFRLILSKTLPFKIRGKKNRRTDSVQLYLGNIVGIVSELNS